MTTVRAQCPSCGDVQLQIDDLTVRVCGDEEMPARTASGAPTASRRCTARRAPRIVDLLVSAAPHERWRWPAELAEPHSGPPLTPDDLLDFHVLLEDDDWFRQLVALVRRTTPE